jgi:transposase InsO family protein
MAPSAVGRLPAQVVRAERGPAQQVDRVARRRRQRQARRPAQAELVICEQAIDITEHPAREGKVFCAVVLDAFSRRVVGWSIDAAPSAALVTNALGMAIDRRRPTESTVIHSDQGTPFCSWAFTRRAQESGLLPSMGAVGSCFDNALMEAFWSRVQVELLDQRAWRTRLELANALFEYLEIFHNRQRRHSSLGMLTPIEFETRPESAGPISAA